MLEFTWPWCWLLLPLPLLLRLLLPATQPARQAALKIPSLEILKSIARQQTLVRNGSNATLWLAVLAWSLLIGAAARPQWVGDLLQLPRSGRDLMLAVDLSESMSVEDFIVDGQAVDRLQATKQVAGNFIARRDSDRLGLILFGEQAYVQTPLTFDHDTLQQLLNEAVLGLAGQRTAIGDAIGLALKRLREQDDNTAEKQVLILLTDGANTAGAVQPLQAAELAANDGLKIYTIGIGADEMLVRSWLGTRRVNPSADLDEKTLKAIAEKTGGRYFRARNTEELENIYNLLDELEPMEHESETFRPRQSLFHWPLSLATLIAGWLLLSRARGWRL